MFTNPGPINVKKGSLLTMHIQKSQGKRPYIFILRKAPPGTKHAFCKAGECLFTRWIDIKDGIATNAINGKSSKKTSVKNQVYWKVKYMCKNCQFDCNLKRFYT